MNRSNNLFKSIAFFATAMFLNFTFLFICNGQSKAGEMIEDGIRNSSTYINLKSEKLSTSDLSNIYQNVIYDNPEFFYISSSFKCFHQNNIVTRVTPTYLFDKSETESMKILFEASAEEIVKSIDKSLPDLNKALLVHDILAQNCRYDLSAEIKQLSYTSYGVLVNKIGVCQGYALAYKYILDKLNIPCVLISSKSMHHAWNAVKINDRYYHVDVTWDSCMNNSIGIVKHDNFMRNEGGIRSTNHTGNDWTNMSLNYAQSDIYSSAFWENSSSAIHYINGSYYYLDSAGHLMKDENMIHKTEYNRWPVYGKNNYFYNGCFSSLCAYNGNLYYSTKDTIYMFNTETGEKSEIYKYMGNEGYIYGFCIKGGHIIYHIATEPNGIGSFDTISLKQTY